MLNEEKKILEDNQFLNTRRNAKEIDKYKKSKICFFVLSIFLCLGIIASTYLLSNKSNIGEIEVRGNIYMSSEDIIELSKLNLYDKFLFVPKSNIEKNIESNILIDSCEVTLQDKKVVCIEVLEHKLIGYAYEDNKNVLILDNDDRYELNKESIYLIEKVPLIEGFSKEDIILIEKNFNSVDYKTINEISEMHYYPELKYQNIMLIMRDGNYIFTSVYGLNILNKYYDIDSSLGIKEDKCYYFEDISGNAYTSACPWQVIEETKTNQ